MNRLLITFYFTFCVTVLFSQSCYKVSRNLGIKSFNEGKYTEANDYFKRANACNDKPGNHDLRNWMKRSNDSINKLSPATIVETATIPDTTKTQNTAKNTPKTPDTPKAQNTAKVRETPKTQETAKTSNTVKAPETEKVQETPKVQEAPKTPEVAKTTNTVKTPETAKAPETAKVPETPKTQETPKTPEVSKTTNTAKAPETAKVQETPKVQEAPKTSEAAKTSNTAKTPETAKVPETPKAQEIPKTPEVANNNSPEETQNVLDIEMILVEGGAFTMGCTDEQGEDCYDGEKPAHEVKLGNFYIGKYEVTQAQWQAVMGSNPSKLRGENLPVDNVSWNEIQEFIGKLNKLTGKKYRLPTEAEWEYAARGGNKSSGFKHSGSNNVNEVAWHSDNSRARVHPVGKRKPNELDIHDMNGNVSEWCEDWFSYNYYQKCKSQGVVTNPKGPSGSTRVIRGGSWNNFTWNCRVSDRSDGAPDTRDNRVGFRLALNGK